MRHTIIKISDPISVKEVIFLGALICVCLSLCGNSKSNEEIFLNFLCG